MITRKHVFRVLAWLALCIFPLVSSAVYAKSTLWEIQSKTNKVYIQGSIHLLKSTDYPIDPAIEQAFENSNVLVLEADIGKMTDPQTQQLILSKGMFSDGKTLEQSLKPKTYQMAKSKVTELGLDIQMFSMLKPWCFAVTIATAKFQALGYLPQYGLDQHFFSKATQQGKTVIGLETVEYQMNLFADLSMVNQDLLVRQTLEDFDVIESQMNTIIRAWSKGDLDDLEETMLQSFKQYPSIHKTFIVDRNRNWILQIESFLKADKNYMVVVGAGHLPGKDGLIQVLKKKGYSVRQL